MPESSTHQSAIQNIAECAEQATENAPWGIKNLAGAALAARPAPTWRRRAFAARLACAALAPVAGARAQRAPVPVPASTPAPTSADVLPRWPVAPPALAARHQRTFAGLAARIAAQWPDVQSVVVLQRGHLAFEHYRPGLAAGALQDTQSVTKSVLALLFGAALADGHVRGLDQLVALVLPEILRLNADARVRQLRFVHLLGMTAGWPGEQTARRDRDDDLRQIVQRPFVAEPGQRFAYDNGAANLLALALARAVRRPLADYARERLFAPLGIPRFSWRQGAQGHALGALGLSLSARGMARVGELVLSQGQWQGRPLLPGDYLRATTERQNAGGAPLFTPYGYLWWVAAEAPSVKGKRRTAMASGYGGQWIEVHPALDAVVATTARRTPDSMARGQALAMIRRDILPALRGAQ